MTSRFCCIRSPSCTVGNPDPLIPVPMPKQKPADDVSTSCPESEWFDAHAHERELMEYAQSWRGKCRYYCVDLFSASGMFKMPASKSEKDEKKMIKK